MIETVEEPTTPLTMTSSNVAMLGLGGLVLRGVLQLALGSSLASAWRVALRHVEVWATPGLEGLRPRSAAPRPM